VGNIAAFRLAMNDDTASREGNSLNSAIDGNVVKFVARLTQRADDLIHVAISCLVLLRLNISIVAAKL
jgi:hypothetical protein